MSKMLAHGLALLPSCCSLPPTNAMVAKHTSPICIHSSGVRQSKLVSSNTSNGKWLEFRLPSTPKSTSAIRSRASVSCCSYSRRFRSISIFLGTWESMEWEICPKPNDRDGNASRGHKVATTCPLECKKGTNTLGSSVFGGSLEPKSGPDLPTARYRSGGGVPFLFPLVSAGACKETNEQSQRMAQANQLMIARQPNLSSLLYL